jgi:molecular chaperone DnaK
MSNILPSGLVEQILKGNCVLFLGTGFGQVDGGGVYDRDLTKELIKYCDYSELDHNLVKVAEYYELTLSRHSLIERVSEWVDSQTILPSLLDKIVAHMPFTIIVTTRIDQSLEDTYRQLGHLLTKVVRDEEVAFADSQKVMLVKIHGSVDQKDTLILTERDHLDLLRKRPILSEFIKLLYATKTILFLGYDLDNTYSKLLHQEIVQEIGKFTRRAYAVWEKPRPYTVRYWSNNSVEIIDSDPLRFLQLLEQELSKRKPERNTSEEKKFKRGYTYPYKYLDHFDTGDSDLFFGRDEEISALSKRFLAHRLIVLFGGSGVGKTSLIKAGFFPEVQHFDVFPIYSRCLDAPLHTLEKAITEAVVAETAWSIDSNDDSDTRLLDLLINCQRAVGKRVLLFIDQFEELFRLPYQEQQEFIMHVARCVNEETRLDLRLVLSLRDDFFSELNKLRDHLPFVYYNVFNLQKLSEISAKQAITGPLEQFDVKYEDNLVDLLIRDLRSEGSIAPAQLQIICSRLYEKFAHEKIITVENYIGLGSASAILGSYLEEVLERFSVPIRGNARRVMQALVSSQKTKKLLSGSEIAQYLGQEWFQVEKIVSDLENYRLLRRMETEDDYKYELVHEYLVNQVWQWLSEEDAKVKEIQELIEIETRYWPKYRTPISKEKLKAIYEHWNQLVLDQPELELLCRSSVTFGYLKQWNEVAESLGDKLVPLYLGLLNDRNFDVVRLAAIALKKLEVIELDHALSTIDQYTAAKVHQAFRQLEAGRPSDDFIEEVSDPGWKEKSLWNMSLVVGIDFGTTSSAIAALRNGKPVIIPNREGSKFTPSVVAFTHHGEIVVGAPAALQAATNPERTIFSIKRRLGTDWKIDIDGITYTEVDIASFIFKSLKQDAESYMERSVPQAVLAVPAYFNSKQRQALSAAAQKAGFVVVRMVAEPTAAALAYGLDLTYDQRIAVYDLGGGTFDISLLELGDGVFEVKAVNGNTLLGGDDFDERIMSYLINNFQDQYHIDLSLDKGAKIRLKEAAERAKIALSGLETVNIYVPYIYADERGVKHLDFDLNRSKFEELTNDLVEETIGCCNHAIADSYIQVQDINELILVGLSTKIPSIRQSVSSFFKKEPIRGVDPDEAVALGVAIEAGVLTGDVRNVLLLDVIPFSIGIETLGGVFTRLIERNTTIPTQRARVFSTSTDNQQSIEIKVFQGEKELAKDNRSLERFILKDIPSAPKGIPQIEVMFDIDANGILTVVAKDKATGKEEKSRISLDIRGPIHQDALSLEQEESVSKRTTQEIGSLPALPNSTTDEPIT